MVRQLQFNDVACATDPDAENCQQKMPFVVLTQFDFGFTSALHFYLRTYGLEEGRYHFSACRPPSGTFCFATQNLSVSTEK